MGLVAYVGEPDEPFNPDRFRLVDPNQKQFDGAIISETLAPGYTFQGRILRPAGVRLRADSPAPAEDPAPVAEVKAPVAETKVPTPEQDDLALEAD